MSESGKWNNISGRQVLAVDETVLKHLETLGYNFEIYFKLGRTYIKETTCDFIFVGDTMEKAIEQLLTEFITLNLHHHKK